MSIFFKVIIILLFLASLYFLFRSLINLGSKNPTLETKKQFSKNLLIRVSFAAAILVFIGILLATGAITPHSPFNLKVS